MLKMSYTNAVKNFAALCDEVLRKSEVVIIGCSNRERVAMLAADELERLLETVHLMRSPEEHTRPLASLERARQQPSGSGSTELEIDVDGVVRE